ncbi:demethylrebeccamycin-D-glucose O-methyltransferase [Variibacter gotjawalensis]|uniref:Demethylrebeccamycin-D-glucose O-methyltransferase n=1 Tax=Variibacter gotjawalensis TaxID=1333996 RepID=A0A0S3Q019_9BRAD|nr:methyltransferase domain-containing protein [Variibacter gotjawalensis]NIK47385.1 ubiquinone/menaquinone biosynthesis C-methylase UbiE [Variibacter gotjawalensis]RZS49281.1 methyltransferase family protein [Variibacter gotjawalensis]BAT61545.1 demethylrebeccamycin-D-glucose O-methyltransferase [Variibacter gotjawalensis]
MGESDQGRGHQGALTHVHVAEHYARGRLVDAIREGLAQTGKSETTVTAEDLAPVDEFHIGGRTATQEIAGELGLTATDNVLDVGCGLGGPARQIAAQYGCRVAGVDLTRDYVETGNVLSGWLKLNDRVTLREGNALSLPFDDQTFSAAYMLHVGMNIGDKHTLFAGVARVLRKRARFAVYDVMRTADGDLPYPLPWASSAATSAVASPADYRDAFRAAGFEIVSVRDRREVALAYFARQKAQAAVAGSAARSAALGLHVLLGARRPEMVRNMSESIAAGLIAPVEIIARMAG